jgi:hypothetical protein
MILKKQVKEKTPLFLKIGVIINVWFVLSPLITILRGGKLDLFSTLMGVVQIIVLIAVWNLRKWAVIAIVLLSVIGFVVTYLAFGQLSGRVIGLILFLRAIVIVPALFYWKRMT